MTRKFKTWTSSKVEEVIASLWFITGFQSMMAGYPKVSMLFFAKAISDAFCIYIAVKAEQADEQKNKS